MIQPPSRSSRRAAMRWSAASVKMIPVTATIGVTKWETSLFPKDGRYIVPVKTVVRKAEGLDAGDTVTVRLTIGV